MKDDFDKIEELEVILKTKTILWLKY